MYYSDAVRILSDAGIEEAQEEARILFEVLGGIPRYKQLGCNPTVDDALIEDALKRRTLREPLAYILGEVAFFHERYRVTKDVLIPRADTEILVESAVKLLPRGSRFADFCTGSGCVAISVLRARPDCTAVCFDVSENALAVARKNAVLNGVLDRASFHRIDLLTETADLDGARFILSNPPYISHEEMSTLAPELAFEPRIALEADEDGLIFYRTFLSRYAELLHEDGFFLFEIGASQADAVTILAEKVGFDATLTHDLGGRARVLHCKPL